MRQHEEGSKRDGVRKGMKCFLADYAYEQQTLLCICSNLFYHKVRCLITAT